MTASGAARLCAEQNFVRSAALGCIKVPSGASKSEIPVGMFFVGLVILGGQVWRCASGRIRGGHLRAGHRSALSSGYSLYGDLALISTAFARARTHASDGPGYVANGNELAAFMRLAVFAHRSPRTRRRSICFSFPCLRQSRCDQPCGHRYDAESDEQDHEGEQTAPERYRVDITVPHSSQRHHGPPEAVKHGCELLCVKGGAKLDHRGGGKLDHPAVEWRG